MKPQTQKWHNDTLSTHSTNMFETLLHQHNLITDSVKAFTFQDENENETNPLRGYLALKETNGKKHKYFLEETHYDNLPVRMDDCTELYLKDSSTRKSIIQYPNKITPFRVKPQQTFPTTKTFIDELANFEHSKPNQWTILKICAVMGYVGKTFLGISSPPETGKSSIFEILHSLTKKSPVFQPRSVPGILAQVSRDGNIVFDEVHQSNNETKRCMENFTLQVAGNKPVYINGAMSAKNTKAKYDVSYQSITFLYNTFKNYKNPQDEFFDNIFSNNDAIDSRILKIKFEGKLLERFNKDFNIIEVAEANKMYYMRVAKMLLWLKVQKILHKYVRKWAYTPHITLKGRKRLIFEELTWLIDMYCDSQGEYDLLVLELETCIASYKNEELKQQVIEAEKVLLFDEACVVHQNCVVDGCFEFECNLGRDNKAYCKEHFKG